LCQIYSDERLDLSKPGPCQAALAMNQWCDGVHLLTKGGYVFVTDYQKNFLIYASDRPSGTQYDDPKTGARFPYWDSVKLDKLKHAVGAGGTAAPFAVANLTSYRLGASARRGAPASPPASPPGAPGEALVTPFLEDADGERVPLLGLDLQAKSDDGKMAPAKEVLDGDGLPTGQYSAQHAADGPIEVSAEVALMPPSGAKTETLHASPEIEKGPAEARPAPCKLHLYGWDGSDYSISAEPAEGPASMKRFVADAKKGGLTSVIIDAKSSHGCAFPSKIAPVAQQSPWDHIAAAVEAGKENGIKIYAAYILGILHKDDAKLHPDWVMMDESGKPSDWYCYMNPDVRNYHISLMKELATSYAIEGIAMDFIRPGGGCFCPRCQKLFEAKYHKPLKGVGPYDPQWLEWKRDAITDYMRQIAAAVRAARPGIKLGGYVWARLAPEKDRAQGQDFPTWLKEGTLDFVFMGNYHSSLPFFRAICRSCKQIADAHGISPDRIMPMPGVGYIQHGYRHHEWNAAMLARELEIVAEEGLTGAGLFTFTAARVHLDVLRAHSAEASR
jgi:uncharacterized lipoprotein YddW (UPF0748 family)